MASIKIVRRKNKERKDGTAPLALRISKDYKTSYTFLGQYVLAKDWDDIAGRVKRSYPNSVRLNNFLMKKLTEANDAVFEASDQVTTKDLKRRVKGQSRQESFFAVAADRVLSKYEEGKYSVAKPELSILYNISEFINFKPPMDKKDFLVALTKKRQERINRSRKSEYTLLDAVKEFKKDKSLYFEDINAAWISKFKTFLISYLGQNSRTLTNQLIFIRTLFNIAIKNGIVEQKYYPFAGEKEKIRIGSGHKIGLTEKEVELIEALEVEPDTSMWHTHKVWLVSFYFAGMRISDVVKLKWSDFQDGRLFYVMNKNEKPLSLKIPDKAAVILDAYKKESKQNNGYVFPFLRDVDPANVQDIFIKTRNATKLFNKYLKRIAASCGIEKNLSNHIARHSFGNIAGDKIHPLMLQKLYRHSDLKTTLNYQANFIHKEADDALDSVINF